jgi:hypothetical protein
LKVCQGTTAPARQYAIHHSRIRHEKIWHLLLCVAEIVRRLPSPARLPAVLRGNRRYGFRGRPANEGKNKPGGFWGTQLRIASLSAVSDLVRRFIMRSKLAIPALVVACTLGATAIASAQTNTTAQPAVESATAAKAEAHHRERTIMRPGTTTGMSRGTPAARHNFYKEPGN